MPGSLALAGIFTQWRLLRHLLLRPAALAAIVTVFVLFVVWGDGNTLTFDFVAGLREAAFFVARFS